MFQLLFLLLFSGSIYANPIIRVIDGDTVLISAKYLPPPLPPQMPLRIQNIDTPEKGHLAKCEKEIQLAMEAKKYAEQLIKNGKNIEIIIKSWDKYARYLGDVKIDGILLSESMINNGLAKHYYGKKKENWCK